jgi:acyl-CoA thioesterase-2
VTSTESSVFDVLVNQVLAVEADGLDRFVGTRPAESFDRVYGGEMAAQGMHAAARTVEPDRLIHSLHVNFLGVGKPTSPVVYSVQRLRDSRQFSTRLVVAAQNDRPIATVMASFQIPRAGLEHGTEPVDLDNVPAPESLPRRSDQLAAEFGAELPPNSAVPWPIDIRYIDHAPWQTQPADAAASTTNRLWVRGDGTLGDDPLVHAGVLTYASDLTMFEPMILAHGGPPYFLKWDQLQRGEVHGATLDHSIWFHRPFRADRWLLHEQHSQVAYGSRGFTTGQFRTADGVHVASVAQEIVILVGPPSNHGAHA